MSIFADRRMHWNDAIEQESTRIWEDYLRDLKGYDLFLFVKDFGHLRELVGGSAELPLASWINHMLWLGERRVRGFLNDRNLPIIERLPLSTYLVWCSKLQGLIRQARRENMHEGNGALAYYSDVLQCAILVSFEMLSEEAVELKGGLAIPQPHAYLDPVQAIRYAKTRSDVDVIKRTLATQQRLVVQRDVIVAVDRDRHRNVFGPTIDTLFLNDWVFVNYLDRGFGEDKGSAKRFLEIGTGNGLLSATIARYAPAKSFLECVDTDMKSILCTEGNVRAQTALRQEASLDSLFLVGSFNARRHPEPFDLVVSNPPYIPTAPGQSSGQHVRGHATVGTSLIEDEIGSLRRILTKGGVLVMVSSMLADPEIQCSARSAGVKLERCMERRVPFDVEGLTERHLEWLVRERELEPVDNSYLHRICIYRLEA